jgi:hypothetical protein
VCKFRGHSSNDAGGTTSVPLAEFSSLASGAAGALLDSFTQIPPTETT